MLTLLRHKVGVIGGIAACDAAGLVFYRRRWLDRLIVPDLAASEAGINLIVSASGLSV